MSGRSFGVAAIAVGTFLLGGVTVLVAAVAMVGAGWAELPGILLSFSMALLFLSAGIGLLRKLAWARRLWMILAVIMLGSLALNVWGWTLSSPRSAQSLASILAMMAFYVAGLIVLARQPEP
ncbi:MAG: hypothetical protein HYZ92_00085 [Candidatus Omnitrophica bacterium]|nr:hypothetical protein [Candidatus Omnitrophota bacterium]